MASGDMVIYVTSPNGSRPTLGELVVLDRLREQGHTADWVPATLASPGQRALPFVGGGGAVTDLPQPDAWFVSVITPRGWPALLRLVDRLGRGAPIVLGGQCSDMMAPWAVPAVADLLIVGDLDAASCERACDMVRAGCGGVVHAGYHNPPASVSYNGITTVFVELGCRRRCEYCRIHSIRPVATNDSALRQVNLCRDRRISLYSPSGDHRVLMPLLRKARSRGLSVISRDYTPNSIEHLDAAGMLPDIRLRTGVEGASERLRRKLRRPLAWDRLAGLMQRRSMHLYMMAGVPGEADDDYAELCSELSAIARRSRHRHWLTLNPLTPVPGTPWSHLDGHLSRAVADRMEMVRAHFRSDGRAGSKVIVSGSRGADSFEHEVAMMRAGSTTMEFLRACTPARVADGTWKNAAENAGIDVESLLAEQDR